MAINSRQINSFAINSQSAGIIAVGSGELISIEQSVAKIGAGELVSIEQDVELRLSSASPASFISIEQVVEATHASGSLISIEQRVQSETPSMVSRAGWDCLLMIDGNEVSNSEIAGNIRITRTENDAALMDITLRPPAGTQNVNSYTGKAVTLDLLTSAGTQRVYTGVVDIPDIDLYQETITLRCTDRRTEQLNSQLPGIVERIGSYSSHIFAEPKDTAQEVEQRLTTTPKSVDFDAYGNYTVTNWLPKATADYTLTDSDIYRQSPDVEFTSRGRITNKINIGIQYRYERFYHHERDFTWTSPIASDICLLLSGGYSMTYRNAVIGAIQSTGWPLKGEINFTGIWPSGWYDCGSATLGWSTISLIGQSVPVTDEAGNQLSDSSGNALYQAKLLSGTNYANLYCMAASWTATTRWAQTVTENYTVSVSAPQSIAQYGTIQDDLNYAIQQESNSASWEDYTSYNENTGFSGNYYIDQDTARNEFNNAVNVAMQQAKTTILGSHRDTRVMVETFIWPEIDLKHTVQISATDLTAKGKVFSIKHDLNVATGEAKTQTTLVLSKVEGATTEDSLAVPAKPSDSVTFVTDQIVLGNHFGEDPTTEAAKSWNGYIGNRNIAATNSLYRSTYQEQFIVDAPAIPSGLRDERTLSSSTSYNVEIPDDTLTIAFDGKA